MCRGQRRLTGVSEEEHNGEIGTHIGGVHDNTITVCCYYVVILAEGDHDGVATDEGGAFAHVELEYALQNFPVIADDEDRALASADNHVIGCKYDPAISAAQFHTHSCSVALSPSKRNRSARRQLPPESSLSYSSSDNSLGYPIASSTASENSCVLGW